MQADERSALDIMANAIMDADGTVAVMSTVIVHLSEGEDKTHCICVLERHHSNDMAGFRKAFDKAHVMLTREAAGCTPPSGGGLTVVNGGAA